MRSHKREMSYVLLNMARALYIPHDLWLEQQCIYGNTSKLTSKYIEYCTTKQLANYNFTNHLDCADCIDPPSYKLNATILLFRSVIKALIFRKKYIL